MLPEILQWIDADLLFASLLETMPSAAARTTHDRDLQRRDKPASVADAYLLRRLVPADLYRETMQLGFVGMHALTFALRHRLTELQQLFHERPATHPIIDNWRQTFGSERWPLFGFSPIGIHVEQRAAGLCRAFDAYVIPTCAEAAEPIFCERHQQEAHWIPTTQGSAQALMYRYYATLENFALYGEIELRKMVGAFWEKIQRRSSHSLDEALQYFGWDDREALHQAGPVGLRRRFLQLSLSQHPDRGGDAGAFVALQEHYQTLKTWLRSAEFS